MSNLKQAWWITQKDIKNEKRYFFWTFIFAGYMAFTISIMIMGQSNADVRFLNPITDFMMLMIMTFLGFYFSRRSFKYLSEDSYTQMLIYFRTLPISPQIVMTYRLLQTFLALAINSIVFFGLLYVVSPSIQEQLAGMGYVAFILTWLGYAMITNAIYIYAEFLNRGKKYFWISSAFVPLMIVIALIINLCGGNLFNLTVEMSHQMGILSPLMWGMLLIGVISLYISSIVTLRKLQTRDLV
ncbi:hypothetical protein [Paenibacillus pini]|uniref:ABC transporter permease protein n=1 Tax=Paenibacillus pini JCM 16418 TaxID=1236976 RepID=W7YY02_9BACL|nr:hypothetical protein [Paenibacillus pini]GAF09541.1 hypothetical protein JCM16418_3684 [Paenibacillus pini JCM 16418]